MNKEEQERFNKANQVVHTVEKEWHYPIMTKYGFVPLDKTGIGFVRSYKYEHPVTKRKITLTTGCRADYWTDVTEEWKSGKSQPSDLWSSLEPYLEKLKIENELYISTCTSKESLDILTSMIGK